MEATLEIQFNYLTPETRTGINRFLESRDLDNFEIKTPQHLALAYAALTDRIRTDLYSKDRNEVSAFINGTLSCVYNDLANKLEN